MNYKRNIFFLISSFELILPAEKEKKNEKNKFEKCLFEEHEQVKLVEKK